MTTAQIPVPDTTVEQARPHAGLTTNRGETIITPLVVEKIATRAASEVDGVGGVAQTGLSRLLPWSVGSDAPARAHAAVGDGTVQLDLTLSVLYPQPVALVTNRVRAQVSRRLAEFCGLRATRVDITVPALVRPAEGARRRVE